MTKKQAETYWARIYLAGPIEPAKQILRSEFIQKDKGLCVTISPTLYLYSGGEEHGYVVELVNYPRFPMSVADIQGRARHLAHLLRAGTHQWSGMIMFPDETEFFSVREEKS